MKIQKIIERKYYNISRKEFPKIIEELLIENREKTNELIDKINEQEDIIAILNGNDLDKKENKPEILDVLRKIDAKTPLGNGWTHVADFLKEIIKEEPKKETPLIPKDKICGQRFGQLLWNAIYKSKLPVIRSGDIADFLFHADNTTLQKAIDDYIESQNIKADY